VYQSIGLHDVIQLSVGRGAGIEIRSADSRVPKDDSNTCWRIVDQAMSAMGAHGRLSAEIEVVACTGVGWVGLRECGWGYVGFGACFEEAAFWG
jgi:hypothetical protein